LSSNIINGCSAPKFILKEGSNATTYQLSRKYQYIDEYIGDYEMINVTRDNGTDRQKLRWFKYYYELNYSQALYPEDFDAVLAIAKGFLNNNVEVTVFPHSDVEQRNNVVILRENDSHIGVQVRGKSLWAYNFGLIIKFKTKFGLTNIDWVKAGDEALRYRPTGRRATRFI